jgi:hypothetical protein
MRTKRQLDGFIPCLASVSSLIVLCIVSPTIAQDAPILKILNQFTAPDVPLSGPAEVGPTTRNWPDADTTPNLPGNGIAQHPMLYAGEGYNTLFLVNNGKVNLDLLLRSRRRDRRCLADDQRPHPLFAHELSGRSNAAKENCVALRRSEGNRDSYVPTDWSG